MKVEDCVVRVFTDFAWIQLALNIQIQSRSAMCNFEILGQDQVVFPLREDLGMLL